MKRFPEQCSAERVQKSYDDFAKQKGRKKFLHRTQKGNRDCSKSFMVSRIDTRSL